MQLLLLKYFETYFEILSTPTFHDGINDEINVTSEMLFHVCALLKTPNKGKEYEKGDSCTL